MFESEVVAFLAFFSPFCLRFPITPNVLTIVVDVTNTEQVETGGECCVDRFGKLHVVIANAGRSVAFGKRPSSVHLVVLSY